MSKHQTTLLGNLLEGDKFQFAHENGTPKSDRIYYVEGQYPKFGCTTVIQEQNIRKCNSGGLHATMVTGVESDQWVNFIQEEVIHVCHKVTFNEHPLPEGMSRLMH